MPFTLSHPAAILPIHKWSKARLPLAALAIGSMTPDVAYFVPLRLGNVSHSLLGILYFCLPAGLALWIVFELLLRRPTVALMPDTLRVRLPLQQTSRSAVHPLNVSVAIMLGALTHVVWDALTDANSPLVALFPVLKAVVLDLNGEPLRLYKFLQHASSIFGLAALTYSAFHWWRRSSADQRRLESADGLSTRWRLAAVTTILIVALVGASTNYLRHAQDSLERQFFHICIGGMSGFAFAWCAAAVLIMWKWRVQETT